MDLGAKIKFLRESAGLTQVAFAKMLNISNSALSQYESGDRIPSDATKIKIADQFDVSLDYLMGRTEQKCISQNHTSSKLPIDKSPGDERALLHSFRQLNSDGQGLAMEYMNYLLASGRYSKDTKTKTSA